VGADGVEPRTLRFLFGRPPTGSTFAASVVGQNTCCMFFVTSTGHEIANIRNTSARSRILRSSETLERSERQLATGFRTGLSGPVVGTGPGPKRTDEAGLSQDLISISGCGRVSRLCSVYEKNEVGSLKVAGETYHRSGQWQSCLPRIFAETEALIAGRWTISCSGSTNSSGGHMDRCVERSKHHRWRSGRDQDSMPVGA